MRKIFCVILSIISLNSFAEIRDTKPIPFKGGVVTPGGVLEVKVGGIVPYKYRFILACDIANDAWSKAYPIVLHIQTRGMVGTRKIQVNDRESTSYQFLMNKRINKLTITNVEISAGDSIIIFKNFDNSDSAIVQNCEARYLV